MSGDYPSFRATYTHEELVEHFLLSPAERALVDTCRAKLLRNFRRQELILSPRPASGRVGRPFAHRGDLTGTELLAIFRGTQITKRGAMSEQVIDDARDLMGRGDNR